MLLTAKTGGRCFAPSLVEAVREVLARHADSVVAGRDVRTRHIPGAAKVNSPLSTMGNISNSLPLRVRAGNFSIAAIIVASQAARKSSSSCWGDFSPFSIAACTAAERYSGERLGHEDHRY